MDKRGRSNKGIPLRFWIRNMQPCAALSHRDVYRQYAPRKPRQYLAVNPGAENCTLSGILALHRQCSALELVKGYAGNVVQRDRSARRPRYDVRVGLLGSSQVRNDVRIEHVHQERSTGLDSGPLIFGGSNSKS